MIDHRDAPDRILENLPFVRHHIVAFLYLCCNKIIDLLDIGVTLISLNVRKEKMIAKITFDP